MSDFTKIAAARKAPREAAQLEWRAALAAEQAADSVEGIRQDLTVIATMLSNLVQAVEKLASVTGRR